MTPSPTLADAVYQAALRQLQQERKTANPGVWNVGPFCLDYNARESWASQSTRTYPTLPGDPFARPAAAPTAPEAR